MDCSGNRHEGGHGRCQRNGVSCFEIVRRHCEDLRVKCIKMRLFTVFGIAMKITRRTWALSMKWHNAQKMTVASYGAHEFTSFRQKVVARIIRFGQKSAWRRTWLLPSSGFGSRTCSALHKMYFNSLWWPEVKVWDEIRHEGGDGHCWQNDVAVNCEQSELKRTY